MPAAYVDTTVFESQTSEALTFSVLVPASVDISRCVLHYTLAVLPALMPIALVDGAVDEELHAISLLDAFVPVTLVDFSVRLQPAEPMVFVALEPSYIDGALRVELSTLAFSHVLSLYHLALVSRLALVLL